MYFIEYPSMADLREEGTMGEAHKDILEACREFLGTEGIKVAQEWIESITLDAWQEEGTKQDLALAMLVTLIESIIRATPVKIGDNEALGATGVQIRLILRCVQAAIAYGPTEVFRLAHVLSQYLDGLRIELAEIKKSQETETTTTEEENHVEKE